MVWAAFIVVDVLSVDKRQSQAFQLASLKVPQTKKRVIPSTGKHACVVFYNVGIDFIWETIEKRDDLVNRRGGREVCGASINQTRHNDWIPKIDVKLADSIVLLDSFILNVDADPKCLIDESRIWVFVGRPQGRQGRHVLPEASRRAIAEAELARVNVDCN